MRIVIVTEAVDNRGNPTNGVRVGRALGRLGHDVRRVDSGTADKQAFKGAEFILAFGTLIRAETACPGIAEGIARLKEPGAVFALWYFDLCNDRMKHDRWKYPTLRRVAPALDWLITTDHSYPWEKHTKRYLHLMQGVEPEDFSGIAGNPEPRVYDVIFTGGVRPPFEYRQRQLDILRRRGFKVDAYGRGLRRRVYGPAFFEAYQRARMAYVPGPPAEASKGYWSNRVYLAAATGTPCLVGYTPGLERHYEDGREVVFFSDAGEMVAGARRLKSDPALRRQMGGLARERTLREHSYEERCKTLMEAIWAS